MHAFFLAAFNKMHIKQIERLAKRRQGLIILKIQNPLHRRRHEMDYKQNSNPKHCKEKIIYKARLITLNFVCFF